MRLAEMAFQSAQNQSRSYAVRDSAMGKMILIAAKRRNQIKQVMPQIKNAVKAGTPVVFLVRCHVSSFQLSCLSSVDALQPGASAALAARYSPFGSQAQLTEQWIVAACEAYSRERMDVSVHFYTGTLRKAIRKYVAQKDVQLIIMPTGVSLRFMRFFGRILPLFRFLKPRQISPASFFRSDAAA
jgi:nucleotide-binding universal stress UspA family protein